MAWFRSWASAPWEFLCAGSLAAFVVLWLGIESQGLSSSLSRQRDITHWRPSMPVLGASEFVFMKQLSACSSHRLHSFQSPFLVVLLVLLVSCSIGYMDTSRLIVVCLDLKRLTDLATTFVGRGIVYFNDLHKHNKK